MTDGAILVCAQQNTPKTFAYESSILPVCVPFCLNFWDNNFFFTFSYGCFAMYATLIVLVTIRLTSQAPLTLDTCSCVWLQIFKDTQLFWRLFLYGAAAQMGLWPLPFEVPASHTIRYTHMQWESSERVISPSQSSLLHNTNTTDEHPCRQRVSNLRHQQSSGRKRTL